MNIKNCENCSKLLHRDSIGSLCLLCRNEKLLSEKFNRWLNGEGLGISVGTTLRGKMREKLLEYYGDNCSICKIVMWNGSKLNLILDHIDGDASNDLKENLRFVCPNCDSQLDTFKSKNKNSARKHRKIQGSGLNGRRANLEN